MVPALRELPPGQGQGLLDELQAFPPGLALGRFLKDPGEQAGVSLSPTPGRLSGVPPRPPFCPKLLEADKPAVTFALDPNPC